MKTIIAGTLILLITAGMAAKAQPREEILGPGQVTATTNAGSSADRPCGEEETIPAESFGQALLGLIMLGILFLCVVGTLAAAGFIILMFFLLATIGIMSASTIVALYKRSLAKGFKFFIIAMSAFLSGALGCLLFWIIAHVAGIAWTKTAILLTGTLVGAAGGAVMGFIVVMAVAAFLRFLKKRFDDNTA